MAKYTQPFLSKQIIKGSNEVDLAKNTHNLFKAKESENSFKRSKCNKNTLYITAVAIV